MRSPLAFPAAVSPELNIIDFARTLVGVATIHRLENRYQLQSKGSRPPVLGPSANGLEARVNRWNGMPDKIPFLNHPGLKGG
jgi:hypothetical protein